MSTFTEQLMAIRANPNSCKLPAIWSCERSYWRRSLAPQSIQRFEVCFQAIKAKDRELWEAKQKAFDDFDHGKRGPLMHDELHTCDQVLARSHAS